MRVRSVESDRKILQIQVRKGATLRDTGQRVVDQTAQRRVVLLHRDAAAFADASPDPTVADITKHIYWEEDHRGPKTTSRGTIIFE